jgi:hypothetical protein
LCITYFTKEAILLGLGNFERFCTLCGLYRKLS